MNFVVITRKGQYIQQYVYNDLKNKKNILFLDDLFQSKNKLLRFFYKLHFNNKINLPFKKLWNTLLCKTSFDEKEEICFIFSANNVNYLKYGLFDYLKNKYKKSFFVFYYQDLVSKMKSLPFEYIKNKFDLVYSFDKGDCFKYGLCYFPLVYSDLSCYLDEKDTLISHDICFVGKVKERYKTIIGAYEKLTKLGFDCDFYLLGVNEEDRKYKNKIHYLDNEISYLENIKIINKSRAILEIMQQDGVGFTLRFNEAVSFKKKLITNNIGVLEIIKKAPKVAWYFDKPENINIDIDDFYSSEHLEAKDFKFSPLDLLDEIKREMKERKMIE